MHETLHRVEQAADDGEKRGSGQAGGSGRSRLKLNLVNVVLVVIVLLTGIAVWVDGRGDDHANSAKGRVSAPAGATVGQVSGQLSIPAVVTGAPILQGQLVVVPTAQTFVAYDIDTGAMRWRSKRCDGARVAAPVGSRSGKRVVVDCGSELRLLDLESGEYQWRYRAPTTWSMLRVGGGIVAVSFGSTAKLLDLDTGKVRFTWRPKTHQREDLVVAPGQGMVVIAEDTVLWAVEPDGSVRWHRDLVGNSVWVGSHGVVVREPAEVVTILDPRTGDTESIDLMDEASSSMAMIVDVQAGRAVVVRNEDERVVYAVDSRTGSYVWSTEVSEQWSYVADGSGYVVVMKDGSCEVRDVADGRRVASCPPDVLHAGIDHGRVAYLSYTDTGRASITVKHLPA